MRSEEERYEAIQLILKKRADGKSWFDIIFDMVTEDCEGSFNFSDDNGDEDLPCTCGLESMSGMYDTVDKCYKWFYPDWDYREEEEIDVTDVGC